MKVLPPLRPPINVRSLAVNTVALWAETITAVVILLWLTPLLIHTFGEGRFGLWREAAAALVVMVALDLGMQATNHRFLSSQLIAANRGGLYRLLNSSLAISLALSAVLTAVMLVLGYALPAIQHVTQDEVALYRQMIWILAACIPLMMLRYPIQSVVLGMQAGYKLAIARTAGQAVFAAMTVIFIKIGWQDLRLVAAAMAANYLLTLAMVFLSARKCLGVMPLAARYITRDEVVRIVRFGASVFLIPVSTILTYHLDPLLIGLLVNENAVTFYVPATMIVLQIRMLSTGVGTPLLPVAAQLAAGGKHELLAELFHSAARLTGTLTVCFLLPLVVFGESFMRLWLGRPFAWTWQVLAVLALGQLVTLTSFPGEQMLIGSGRIKLAAWASLLAGVAKVGMGIAALGLLVGFGGEATGYWPLMGLALATTLPLLVLQGVIFPVCFCRQIGVSLGLYTARTLGRIALSIMPVAAVLLALRHWWQPGNLLGQKAAFVECILQLAVGFALTAAAGWLIALTTRDRDYLLGMLRGRSKQQISNIE